MTIPSAQFPGSASNYQDVYVTNSWTAGQNPTGRVVYTAGPNGAVVLEVDTFVNAAETASASIQPVIVTSGTTVTSGATLTTAAMNGQGTASTAGTLTLIATPTLAAGQMIGLSGTGTFSLGSGSIGFRVKELSPQ